MVAGTGPPEKDATCVSRTGNILGLENSEELDTIWIQKYHILSNDSNNEKREKSSCGKSLFTMQSLIQRYFQGRQLATRKEVNE